MISLEEFNSLLETVHLLKSEANALQLSRSIEEYKQGNNVQVDLKINRLIHDISRTPFSGLGKPEGLKGSLVGFWSRRIDREHRLVYRVDDGEIVVISCRYHY